MAKKPCTNATNEQKKAATAAANEQKKAATAAANEQKKAATANEKKQRKAEEECAAATTKMNKAAETMQEAADVEAFMMQGVADGKAMGRALEAAVTKRKKVETKWKQAKDDVDSKTEAITLRFPPAPVPAAA